MVGFRHEGPDAARRVIGSSVSLGLWFPIAEVVDHREPRAVLLRLAPDSGTQQMELPAFLALYETGADGRVLTVTTYDAEDLEAALAHLDGGVQH